MITKQKIYMNQNIMKKSNKSILNYKKICYNLITCLCGEIGRRAGLKIQW